MAIPPLPWCCTTGVAPFRANNRLSQLSAARSFHRTGHVFRNLLTIHNTSRFSHTTALAEHMRHLDNHKSPEHHHGLLTNQHCGINTHEFHYIKNKKNEFVAKILADIERHGKNTAEHHKALRNAERINTLPQNSHSRSYSKLTEMITTAPQGTNEHSNKTTTGRTTSVQTRHDVGATTNTQIRPVKEAIFYITLFSFTTRIRNSENMSQQTAFQQARLESLQKLLDELDTKKDSDTEKTAETTVERQNISTATTIAKIDSLPEKSQKNVPLRYQEESAVSPRQQNTPAVITHNSIIRDDKALKTDAAADNAINAIAHDRQMNTNNHGQHPDKDQNISDPAANSTLDLSHSISPS